MSVEAWGWDAEWLGRLAELGLEEAHVGRVTGQDRDRWSIQTADGPFPARLTSAKQLDPFPVVGDWVVAPPGPTPSDPRSIVAVLPRRSAFSRGTPLTGTKEHVLAANVDVAYIVHGLDLPVNARRLERYLAMAWESGASPAVVLTKADLAEDGSASLEEARRLAMGAPVHRVAANDPASVEALRASMRAGSTAVLLGPSGVGKSTLVNALGGGPLAETGEVRTADRKGRHTTVRRQLHRIPGGALLLDTPGIRELRVWDLDEGLHRAFPDIDGLSETCRFRDCSHEAEPGCGVLAAVAEGRLEAARLESWRKLLAEAAHQRRKSDPLARAAAVSEHKTAMKTLKRDHPKYRR